MNKINYETITDQQLIDIRTQDAIQAGHAIGSLNLTVGNFKKFAHHYLTEDQPIIFVTEDDNQATLDDIDTLTQDMGYTQVDGYILANDIPQEDLQQLDTITAADFLNKDDDYILLDVRNPDEITRLAPEKNLTNIPFEDLPHSHQSLDSSKTIYTLCGSGNRGTAAASYLINKGFKPTVIEGGMKAIQEITQA